MRGPTQVEWDLGACQEDLSEAAALIKGIVNRDPEAYDRAVEWLSEHETFYPGPETM